MLNEIAQNIDGSIPCFVRQGIMFCNASFRYLSESGSLNSGRSYLRLYASNRISGSLTENDANAVLRDRISAFIENADVNSGSAVFFDVPSEYFHIAKDVVIDKDLSVISSYTLRDRAKEDLSSVCFFAVPERCGRKMKVERIRAEPTFKGVISAKMQSSIIESVLPMLRHEDNEFMIFEGADYLASLIKATDTGCSVIALEPDIKKFDLMVRNLCVELSDEERWTIDSKMYDTTLMLPFCTTTEGAVN